MQTNETVAIKIIHKENIRQRNLSLRVKKEVSIMKQLKHPHVAKVTDVLQSPNEIFIVMEYISRGELRSEVAKKGFEYCMQPFVDAKFTHSSPCQQEVSSTRTRHGDISGR